MELYYHVRFVDEQGRDVTRWVKSTPGFEQFFMMVYNEGVDYFNERIESANKMFDEMYPDHEIDMDDVNDIYFEFIRKRMQPIYDILTEKYLGKNSGMRFGLFAEMATFALLYEDGHMVSFVLKPVK